MTDPIQFSSATERFGLPLLFAGQAQKEFIVNESLARLDALLHLQVEAKADDPPAGATDGRAWIVGSSPIGEWLGHAGKLAVRQSGYWTFIQPIDGMRAFDVSTGRSLLFFGEWHAAQRPATPAGGTTVDIEARAAISELCDALATAGIIPAS